MKKIVSISLLFVVIAFPTISINAGSPLDETIMPKTSGESINLFTDRQVYIVNEKIFYSANYKQPIKNKDVEWSAAIYLELIRWNGAKIAQTKTSIENFNASGFLTIPGDLESGVYYLRAYTKWMRNYSPYSYTYLPLKIVNPFTKKTEIGPKGVEAIEKSEVVNRTGIANAIQINGLGETYAQREEVKISIGVLDDVFKGNYTVSAIKMGGIDSLQTSFSFKNNIDEINSSEIEYIPELRGISLSGKAVDRITRKAEIGLKINLSSAEYSIYFASATTDSAGRFLFTFPDLEGQHEFHISYEARNEQSVELLIDSDFCNLPVMLPYVAFQLSDEEKPMVQEIVRNMELSQRYALSDTLNSARMLSPLPFYGSPTRTIYEKEFIELNNLEEFIFELVYEVYVRYKDGIPNIYVTGQSTLSSYPVLVLVDNIMVNDIEELLKVSCRRIDRIEIVNGGYVIGEYMYSGIVSIFSEGKDMAGINLGKSSNFFALALFDGADYSFPVYPDGKERNRIPDRRNTLYWEPKIELSKGSDQELSFFTSDAKGEYEILVQGTDKEGNMIEYRSEAFSVE